MPAVPPWFTVSRALIGMPSHPWQLTYALRRSLIAGNPANRCALSGPLNGSHLVPALTIPGSLLARFRLLPRFIGL